jgi:hypothetical protein
MPYVIVMVYVDAEGTPEQRVRLAARLADKFNATLIGLSALAIRPAFMAEGVVVQDLLHSDIKETRGSWFRTIAARITASSNGVRCWTSRMKRSPVRRGAPISS